MLFEELCVQKLTATAMAINSTAMRCLVDSTGMKKRLKHTEMYRHARDMTSRRIGVTRETLWKDLSVDTLTKMPLHENLSKTMLQNYFNTSCNPLYTFRPKTRHPEALHLCLT